jgi:hypothetical protein
MMLTSVVKAFVLSQTAARKAQPHVTRAPQALVDVHSKTAAAGAQQPQTAHGSAEERISVYVWTCWPPVVPDLTASKEEPQQPEARPAVIHDSTCLALDIGCRSVFACACETSRSQCSRDNALHSTCTQACSMGSAAQLIAEKLCTYISTGWRILVVSCAADRRCSAPCSAPLW